MQVKNVSKELTKQFSGGSGDIVASIQLEDPTKPLVENENDLLSIKLGLTASKPLVLGNGGLKLNIKSSTSATLTPFWSLPADAARRKQLSELGLDRFWTDGKNADRLLLAFDVGASADVSAGGSVKLSPWTIGATLEAGVDAHYVYAKPYPETEPSSDVVDDFFRSVTTPSSLDHALARDEALLWELGGALTFGVKASAGYEMATLRRSSVGGLKLEENFGFRALGSLSFQTQLAGRYRIEIRGIGDNKMVVTLRKSDRRAYAIAAEIGVDLKTHIDGLPQHANDFLGALLGVRAKNWFDRIVEIGQYSDPAELEKLVDGLTKKFIAKWSGTALDSFLTMLPADLKKVMDDIKKVGEAYVSLEDRVVSIFERFFDAKTAQLAKNAATALAWINTLPSFSDLKGKVLNDEQSELLDLLTEGRLLDYIAEGDAALKRVKDLARKILDLDAAEDAISKKIREVIQQAKSEFALDTLLKEAASFDADTLKAKVNQKVYAFVERWVGRAFDQLEKSELNDVLAEIRAASKNFQTFANRWYDKLQKAADQSITAEIHAAYNRESNDASLFKFELDFSKRAADCKRIMGQIERADFSGIVDPSNADFVNILQGALTDAVKRTRTLTVNAVLNGEKWSYRNVSGIVQNTEQKITSGSGGIVVDTTLTTSVTHERERQKERLFTDFVFNFVAQSTDPAFDKHDRRFLLDSIRDMSAHYDLVQSDSHTTATELQDYLALATELGFGKATDGVVNDLQSLLQKNANGEYGDTKLTYQVRFDDAGVAAMFSHSVPEKELRSLMRKLLLWNYVHANKPELGWAYYYAVERDFALAQPNDFRTHSDEWVPLPAVAANRPFPNLKPPERILLRQFTRRILYVLYVFENAAVAALEKVRNLVGGATPFEPKHFQNAMADFANALNGYDEFDDGPNTIFALMDAMIRLATPGAPRRSSLLIEQQLKGEQRLRRMLIA